MVSKCHSPDYFRNKADQIWRWRPNHDKAWAEFFSYVCEILDFDDLREFNKLNAVFMEKWVYSVFDIEKFINNNFISGRVTRIIRDGKKFYLVNEEIQQDLYNLKYWAFKKLNDYYGIYGIDVTGIEQSQIDNIPGRAK